MDYKNRLKYQSCYWYNEGLNRANMSDITGAINCLKRSLQYNKENIPARNLLGLVYFGVGEVGRALVQWIISKNMQSHENIAEYYISKVQETPSELENMNQAIHKFNQCLDYSRRNGEDLALIQLKKVISLHPTYLKAYQLMALLYIRTEQFKKAREILKRAYKMDITNPQTLLYMQEMSAHKDNRSRSLWRHNEDDSMQEMQVKNETIDYKMGNETIIQPAHSKNKGLQRQMMQYLVLGAIIGCAFTWFLLAPAANYKKTANTNEQITGYTDQIAADEAQISALKNELSSYRDTSEDSEKNAATAKDTQTSYENLIKLESQYKGGQTSNADMLKVIQKINSDSLGKQGAAAFKPIYDDLVPDELKTQFAAGKSSYDSGDYASAITALTTVVALNEKYQDGQALLLLANAYAKNNDKDNAKTYYQRVIDLYPDSDYAKEAKVAIS